MSGQPKRRGWRASVTLVLALLSVWFVVSFGCGILFVEPLNEIRIGGFPLGFWFAQQGSIAVFIVLIAIYCVVMDRWERQAARDAESAG